MQGRSGAIFQRTASTKSMQACLRTRDAPHHVTLRPGVHLRHITAPVLAAAVHAFVAGAAQRNALLVWLQAVTCTAGRGSAELPLPGELMAAGRLNLTVAALVVAVGQQLDVVAAATHDLQEWLEGQTDVAADEPLLLWTCTLCRPILSRLDFVYHAFSDAIGRTLYSGRSALRPGGAVANGGAPGRDAPPERQALVTKAAIDSLHEALGTVEKLPGRCATRPAPRSSPVNMQDTRTCTAPSARNMPCTSPQPSPPCRSVAFHGTVGPRV